MTHVRTKFTLLVSLLFVATTTVAQSLPSWNDTPA
jgi:hypothetical protein